ncbi:lysyl oxidase 1 [Grus japonensis]|uniref:Lysyl oxidase 1 n=1 Tax=Grus japonensis TaxID=30415 RepID=A0ABC9X8E9_GRUJA
MGCLSAMLQGLDVQRLHMRRSQSVADKQQLEKILLLSCMCNAEAGEWSYQQGFCGMLLLFHLLVEKEREVYWLFQFFLRQTEHSCVMNIDMGKNLIMLKILVAFMDPTFAKHLGTLSILHQSDQVPENWREGPVGDSTASQRVRPAGRSRQASSSSSSSSFAYASVGQPAYPQFPFAPQYEPYEAPRAYDEAYTYYRSTGTGGAAVASAAAGASVVYPFQPRARYEDYGEEQSPYRAQGYYPAAERPYVPAAPQLVDGLDRRYSHSLYHDAGGSPEQVGPDSYANQQPAGHGIASTDNLQAPAGTGYGSQYPPYEPQPPFRAVEPYGVPRPESYLPARNPEIPQAVPDSQARVSVGSVYRPSHGGRGLDW